MIAIGDAFLVAMIGGLIFALYRGLRPAVGLALIAVLVLILTRYGLLQAATGAYLCFELASGANGSPNALA